MSFFANGFLFQKGADLRRVFLVLMADEGQLGLIFGVFWGDGLLACAICEKGVFLGLFLGEVGFLQDVCQSTCRYGDASTEWHKRGYPQRKRG